MKHIVEISGQKVLLSPEQLEELTALLIGVDTLDSSYIGSNRGDDGGNYANRLAPFRSHDHLITRCMHDGYYAMLKLRDDAWVEAQKRGTL
jgi:hypothetical protein